MRRFLAMLVVSVGPLLAQLPPSEYLGVMQQGVRALVTRRYDDAVTAFQRAVELAPAALNPRLNLATAQMRQYDPGSISTENAAIANRCHLEFLRALDLDPKNMFAIVSIGVLLFGEASATSDEQARVRLLAESREWYRKAVGIEPGSREFWYSMARDAWARWYPDYRGPLFQ